MPRRKPNLEDLQRVWDEKLRLRGFVDIEDRRTGQLKVSIRTSTLSDDYQPKRARLPADRSSSVVGKLARAEYYRMAGSFLHSRRFKREDRQVWALHSDGTSNRKIALRFNLPLIRVRRIIARLRAEMMSPKDS